MDLSIQKVKLKLREHHYFTSQNRGWLFSVVSAKGTRNSLRRVSATGSERISIMIEEKNALLKLIGN